MLFDSPAITDYDPSHAICQRPAPVRSFQPMMEWRSWTAVAVGGTLGCLLRWCLSFLLNRYFPTVPPGTLAANLVGAYVIGAAFALVTLNPSMPMEWRLFVMTGFCGGLTTFSTFSLEVVLLLQNGRTGWAMGTIAVHLAGSLLMTLAGIVSVHWVRS